MNTPLTVEQLRARQLRLLDLAVEHCESTGIRYYLCAGTLLGAVRHHGYVPWDDDIDLMMPRPDFEKFCASFASSTAAAVSLRTHRSPGYVLPFAKVCDDTTRLDVESDIVRGLGVYIDVFPLDAWCASWWARAIQAGTLKSLAHIMRIKHLSLNRNRSALRNGVLSLGKFALRWVGATWVCHGLERVAQLGRFANAPALGVLVWGYQERVRADAYGSPSTVLFEGRTLAAPRDPDQVLRGLYGSYWELPDPKDRVSHHRFIAFET